MVIVALCIVVDWIVLGGIGLINDDYFYFKSVFENVGVFYCIVSFVNIIEDLIVECLFVFDMVLIVVEYFVVEKKEKVLVLFIDMIFYVDVLSIVFNCMD